MNKEEGKESKRAFANFAHICHKQIAERKPSRMALPLPFPFFLPNVHPFNNRILSAIRGIIHLFSAKCLLPRNIQNWKLLGLAVFAGIFPTGYIRSEVTPAQRRHHYFERITVEHGLPINTIRCILQDKRGFLWLGTHNGLARYDGYNFKIYANDPNDPSSLLADNGFNVLFEDRSGTIWVATNKGLYTIDPITETLSKFPVREMDRPGVIRDFDNRSFYIDSRNHLWLGTRDNGLIEINAKGHIIAHYRHRAADPDSLNSDLISAIFEDTRGDLWVGTKTGLDRLDRNTGIFHHCTRKLVKVGAGTIEITDINEDRSGVVWIGTKGGLFNYDPETDSFTHFQHREGDPGSLSDNNVQCLWEDSDGIMWIGTETGGLNALDRERKVFKYFPSGDLEYPILSLHKDRSGILWIGTDDGGLLKM